MTQEVIVDFSRVEAAYDNIAQERRLAAERIRAAFAKERAAAAAKVTLCGAAALALIIVSIGVAIWLSKQRHVIEATRISPPVKEAIVSPPSSVPLIPVVPANKIKTDV